MVASWDLESRIRTSRVHLGVHIASGTLLLQNCYSVVFVVYTHEAIVQGVYAYVVFRFPDAHGALAVVCSLASGEFDPVCCIYICMHATRN